MNLVESAKNFLKIQFNKPRWIRRSIGYKSEGIAYVRYHGKKIFLYLGDLYGPSYHLMHWGVETYEAENCRLVKTVIGTEGVFLDIGANIGIFSLVASFQGPKVKVFSFDPDKKARECLAASIKANNCQNIEIYSHAVSDTQGEATFFLDANNHGGNSLNHESIEADVNTLPRETVKMTTVDHFVAEKGLRNIDLIKIDVQLHEFEVLAGAINTLKTLRPIVFVECSSVYFGGDKDPFNHFKDLNYQVFDPLTSEIFTLAEAQVVYKTRAVYSDLFFFPVEKKSVLSSN